MSSDHQSTDERSSRIHVGSQSEFISQIVKNEYSAITVTTEHDPEEYGECDGISSPDGPLLSESGLYDLLKCGDHLGQTKFIVSSSNLLDYIKICISCRSNDDSTTHVQYYTHGAVCQFKFLCSKCGKRWEFCTLGTDNVRSWRNENAVLMSPILLTKSQPSKVKSYIDPCNIVYPEVNSYFQTQTELTIPAANPLWASENGKMSDIQEQNDDEFLYEEPGGNTHVNEDPAALHIPSALNNPKKEVLIMIENFKTVYLENGAESYKTHQPYLKKLADYYCHKYSKELDMEPRGGSWVDLFKAFTLYNSAAVGNEDYLLHNETWSVVERFLGDNNNTNQHGFYSTVQMLQKQLEAIRSDLRKDVDLLDRQLKGSPFKYRKEMREIITNSNKLMVEFANRIFVEAMNCIREKPPCDFSVVGIGSIGRGEATPFSDLEYMFLLKDKEAKSYFESLAVMSYFIIGALKETNLKIADVEELNGWFVDKRRRGFQIDGITKKSGNVPTGYGEDDRRNEFLVTPEELIIRYQDVMKDPDRTRAIHGDVTAMVSFTTLLFTTQEHESLLQQFTIEKSRVQKPKGRIEIDQKMLENDLEHFAFDPEYDVYSSGFSLNVKQLVYRFPSIVLQDMAIITETCKGDSWDTLDSWHQLVESSNDGDSFASQLASLLAVACYSRLRCYLHMNSGENPFRITQCENQKDEVKLDGRILQFKQHPSLWEMAREEFLELAKLIINLQQHLLSCKSKGLSKENLRTAVSTSVDSSHQALLLAHYFCCEWCLVLMEIQGVNKKIQSFPGSISPNICVNNAIAFSYQQCKLHTEALQWYKIVCENINVLTKKQLTSVYRGIAKCHLERNELSEANTAFQEALKLCGMQDIDRNTAMDHTAGTECMDLGMVLLEAGCFNYKTEKNAPLALRLLFIAMEQLILAAANVKENKSHLLADFDTLTYSRRLVYASNPSRPLAHCLFALSELLGSVNSEYAPLYFQKAQKLGLKMVVDKDVDDLNKASILQDLGKQTRNRKYLETALLLLEQRVPMYAAPGVKCDVLLSLGELAASTAKGDEDHAEPEQEEEERELDEMIAALRTDQEALAEQDGRWTQREIEDWSLKTKKALECAYKNAPHVDKANGHKIHADLLAAYPNYTEEAIECYEQARSAFENVGSRLGVAAVAQSQANLLRTVQCNGEAAEELYSEAQEIIEDIFKDQLSSRLLAEVKEKRAENLRSVNRNADADKFMQEVEGMKAEIKKVNDTVEMAIESLHGGSSIDQAEARVSSAKETTHCTPSQKEQDDSREAESLPDELSAEEPRMSADTEVIGTDMAALHDTSHCLRETEHTITDSGGVTETADKAQLSDKQESSIRPTNITLVREVKVEGGCLTVCSYENQTYLGLGDGSVVRIGPDYKVTPFMALDKAISGMDVYKGRVYTVQRGEPQTVSVHELSTGKLLHTWTHTDNRSYVTSDLAIVGDQVVITDRDNKRVTVYSLTGQLIKHIPCDIISAGPVLICSADTSSLIVSSYDRDKVPRIHIPTGQVMWTSSCVTNPLGVTCYNQYVLVYEEGYQTKIHILDISTGDHVGELVDSKKWSGNGVYSLYTAGDTLIVPRYLDKTVLFYKLDSLG